MIGSGAEARFHGRGRAGAERTQVDAAAVRGGWTRRRALAALAALAGSPALPAAAAPPLPRQLAAICRAATKGALPARLGAAAAAGQTASELAASLCRRLGPGAAADWREALVRSGRRDLAANDRVEILGRPLMRTEAEVLALGALLRGAA